ncbi:transposase domain-containing protein [Rhodospirillaceae bacterium SYSU D60014]|uniref:transposase domain-containing protein n=1 Tax=Virgifigura deserti TaxID=2268457 RepID=UPI000E66C5C5
MAARAVRVPRRWPHQFDNNPVERAIRPVALGARATCSPVSQQPTRRWPIIAIGDDGGERWATVCSFIAAARLNDGEPDSYLADVFQRVVGGHPMSRIDDLLPWNWAPETRLSPTKRATPERIRRGKG